MDNGEIFEIKVNDLSDENIYVTKVILNGNLFNQVWFKHINIKDGEKLELEHFISNTPVIGRLKTHHPH